MSGEIAVNSYEEGRMSVTPPPVSKEWTKTKDVM
jgi:hypothetical protein